MKNECLICKHHFTQSGKCNEEKRNCLQFENEVRGEIVYKTVIFEIPYPYSKKIEIGKKYKFIGDSQEFEAEVISISYIDFTKQTMRIKIAYHANDWISKEDRKKYFSIIK